MYLRTPTIEGTMSLSDRTVQKFIRESLVTQDWPARLMLGDIQADLELEDSGIPNVGKVIAKNL